MRRAPSIPLRVPPPPVLPTLPERAAGDAAPSGAAGDAAPSGDAAAAAADEGDAPADYVEPDVRSCGTQSDAGYGFEAPIWAPKAHRKPRLINPTKVLEARAEARAARQRAKAAKAAKEERWRDEMGRREASSSPPAAKAKAGAAVGRRAARSTAANAAAASTASSEAPQVRAVLGDGWLELAHPERAGATYFHHRLTGETTWVRPNTSDLPEGWLELVDPESGLSYYHEAATGHTSWRRPGGADAATDSTDAPPAPGHVDAAAPASDSLSLGSPAAEPAPAPREESNGGEAEPADDASDEDLAREREA